MPEVALIRHMTSFSRSGETVMLRTFHAHPRVHVVHQLFEPDTPEDFALFKTLRARRETTIPVDHPKLAHRHVKPGDTLLLKNAVWTHRWPYEGFILVRAPWALLASAGAMSTTPKMRAIHAEQTARWAHGIDPALVEPLRGADAVTAFSTLWARKMGDALDTGLPIVRYEDFVSDPEAVLRSLCAALDLEFDPAMLRAHEGFAEGRFGHGTIPLWEPVHERSKSRQLRLEHFERAVAICGDVARAYGYETVWTPPAESRKS